MKAVTFLSYSHTRNMIYHLRIEGSRVEVKKKKCLLIDNEMDVNWKIKGLTVRRFDKPDIFTVKSGLMLQFL